MRIMMKKKGTGVVSVNPEYGDLTLIKSLDNPNPFGTSVDDYFGFSVDTDGTHAIVGAYQEDDVGVSTSGKAYIYNSVTGDLIHTLANPDTTAARDNDQFGYSVAIDGNYALVGAKYKEDLIAEYSGTVYIFNVTTGDLIHTLVNPNTDNAGGYTTWDQFGTSLDIRGEYAVISSPGVEASGVVDSGRIYVYNVVTGNELHRVNNPNPDGSGGNDYFGSNTALSVSDTHFIVGAYRESQDGSNSGKAYVYLLSTGAFVHTLSNPNTFGTTAQDWFGYSVSIEGNYAIVGALAEDDAVGAQSGKAYIFDVTTGNHIHTFDNPNPFGTSAGDQFGCSVSLSGNYVMVGANVEDDAGGENSGKAYIFKTTTGDWTDTTLAYTLDNPSTFGTSAGDKFGEAVSISGNHAIVGSSFEDDASGSNSGKAYIYGVP